MAVIQRVGSPAKPRKWMSVHEMGDMLGLKKTDRYWLVQIGRASCRERV